MYVCLTISLYTHYKSNYRLDNISQVLNEDSSSDTNRFAFLCYFQLVTIARIMTQMLRLLLVVMNM